ncbi:MerR family transcriptional regulator [Streptomyces javensis]|uniref:helix-turn-helix domain-containing protein n=1 Tax=Streptomyces javensis TaxID=114698 RepID=UPI0033FBB734
MTRGTQGGNTDGTQGGNSRGTQNGSTVGAQGGNPVGIGELAARTGLPVKTIRYYSDTGLLPESGRTPGGHRRYAADALPRLRLIQRLRALGTPIAAIAAVMAGERSLGELITRELDVVREQLREATWRREVLRALDDCPAPERPHRLDLLAGVGKPDDAHDRLVRYWHWALPAGLPRRLAQAVIVGAVPTPPAAPTAATVLAYAELRALATADDRRRQPQPHQVGDVASFYAGLLDACALAGEALAADCPDRLAEAHGHFVRAYPRRRPRRHAGVPLASARPVPPRDARRFVLTALLATGPRHHRRGPTAGRGLRPGAPRGTTRRPVPPGRGPPAERERPVSGPGWPTAGPEPATGHPTGSEVRGRPRISG